MTLLTMPYNEKSLANLSGGSKPGQRKNVTIKLVRDMTSVLAVSYTEFITRMESLSDKDYCDVYLKLMKLVIPKTVNLDIDTPNEKHKFVIHLASTLTDEQKESGNY